MRRASKVLEDGEYYNDLVFAYLIMERKRDYMHASGDYGRSCPSRLLEGKPVKGQVYPSRLRIFKSAGPQP